MKKYSIALFRYILVSIILIGLVVTSCSNKNKDPDIKPDVKYEKMKVISYNIWDAFRRDDVKFHEETIATFVAWVKKEDPDILILQEMYWMDQAYLDDLAKKYGHQYAVLGAPQRAPVAITSKYPITEVEKVIEGMWHGYMYAKVKGIHLYAVHLTPYGDGKGIIQEEIAIILDSSTKHPRNEYVLMAGDFNSYSMRDAAEYTPSATTFYVTREIETAGFKDSFKMLEQNKAFKNSLTNSRARIDYIYLNEALSKNILSADIIHDDITKVLSDHYPVIAEFNIDQQ